MESAYRVQILGEDVCTSSYVNIFFKGMNPCLSSYG